MEVEQRNKMRTLMQREAELHFDTYTEVNDLIAQYCDQRQIQLVLRYNSQQMDPNEPATIMQRVNGSIIYYAPDKDITQQLIAQLIQMKGSASLGDRCLTSIASSFDLTHPLKVGNLVQEKRQQSTIVKSTSVSGFGFWSGQDVTIEFRPAAENTGIVFVRTDLAQCSTDPGSGSESGARSTPYHAGLRWLRGRNGGTCDGCTGGFADRQLRSARRSSRNAGHGRIFDRFRQRLDRCRARIATCNSRSRVR